MFCPNCGSQLADTAVFCSNCGASMRGAAPGTQPPPPPATPPPPGPPTGTYTQPLPYSTGPAPVVSVTVPNYLVQAILVTLFCCLPFGIVAIIKASSVNTKIALGDIAGAMQASNEAKKWCWISAGCAIGIWVLYILLMIFGVMSGIMHSGSTNF